MSTAILVAVPSLRRPERLDVLLPLLVQQAAESGAEVLVVDNDPEGSAAEVAHRHGVRHCVEPARGLAAVRNRALDEAAAAEALVFIDDDEVPSEGWLTALTDAWRRTGAAAVSGRVVTRFPDGFADPWILGGGFFTRVTFAPDERQPVAATNNLLLDTAALRARGLRFDEAFGLTGGEDIDLTSRLRRAGGEIVSCPAALVWDDVDPSRLTRRWVLRRAYRVGVSTVQVALRPGGPRMARRLRWTASGLIRIVVGSLRRVAGVLLRSPRHSARGARAVWRGAGMVAGAWGAEYREYALRSIG